MIGRTVNRRAALVRLILVGGLLAGCDLLAPFTPDTESGGGDGGGEETVVSNRTYYVAADGSDRADGLTRAAAFATLARAAAQVQPGDTLVILPGVYAGTLSLESVGSAAAPITITGEGDGAVVDGGGTGDIGVSCVECTNVVVEALEVRNHTDVGVLVTAGRDITLRRLVVHDNGFAPTQSWVEGYGIHVDQSRGVTITDNEVRRNGPSPQTPNRRLGTGINTFGNSEVIIRANRSRDNIGAGLLVEDSVNVLVEENTITGNDLDATIEGWWDGAVWVDGGRDVTLRRNVVSDNLGPGLQISDEDNQRPSGYVLEHNTVTGNYFGLYLWNFGTTGFPPDDVLRMTGNDISGNTRQDIWIEAQLCPPDDPCD